jgi:hypothetical protein
VGGFILIRVNAGGTLTVDFASEVAASAVTIQPDADPDQAQPAAVRRAPLTAGKRTPPPPIPKAVGAFLRAR